MTAAEPVRANVCRDFLRKFEPCGLEPSRLTVFVKQHYIADVLYGSCWRGPRGG